MSNITLKSRKQSRNELFKNRPDIKKEIIKTQSQFEKYKRELRLKLQEGDTDTKDTES